MKKKSSYRRIVALQLLVIVGIATCGELAARWHVNRRTPVAVPSGLRHPPYFNNPNTVAFFSDSGINQSYRINALGLRGPEIGLKKQAGVKRILILGDSVVFGTKVADDQTLAVQLEEILNSRGKERWQVLNGGVAGYDILDYEGFLKFKGFAFEPDIIVLGLYMNDHVSVESAAAAPVSARRRRSLVGTVRDILLNSALVRYGVNVLNDYQTAKKPFFSYAKPLPAAMRAAIDDFFPGDSGSASALIRFLEVYRFEPGIVVDQFLPWVMNLKGWQNIRAPLARMREACRARRIPFMAAVFPLQFQVYPGVVYPEPQRTVGRILDSLHIPWLDFREVFRATGAGDEFFVYRYDFHHPNGRAYRLAAEALAHKLTAAGLVQ